MTKDDEKKFKKQLEELENEKIEALKEINEEIRGLKLELIEEDYKAVLARWRADISRRRLDEILG